jgi:hypothetical protein
MEYQQSCADCRNNKHFDSICRAGHEIIKKVKTEEGNMFIRVGPPGGKCKDFKPEEL